MEYLRIFETESEYAETKDIQISYIRETDRLVYHKSEESTSDKSINVSDDK
jgi:hypothetical protein